MRGRMVAHARHRSQRGPRARRRARATSWRPSAGKPGERYILGHAAATSRWPGSSRCWPRSPAARAPRFRVPYALAWCAAAACEGVARAHPPAARRALTAVRMARKRMYFSAAKAVRELGLPQTDPSIALRDAVAWFVGARLCAPRRAYERSCNLQFVARLTRKSRSNFFYAFLSLPRARRDALYAVYAFCRTWTTPSTSATIRAAQRRGARALADGGRAVLRAGPAPEHPIAQQLREAVRAPIPIPRAALEAIIDGVRDGSRARRRYETLRGSLSVLLPRGLGGRSLLRRDLRLHRPARPRVRRAPRHRAAAHEHHPRRGHRRAASAACTCRRRT